MIRCRRQLNTCLTAVLGGLVILLLQAPADGQGDSRIETGNVLDANPQVGSGGTNTPVRSYQALDSQLYINGQVTGLGGFRGNVPYSSPNELSLTLPGGSVRSFRQRSVGLSQVMAGGTYQPQAYLDRAQTSLNLRALTSGYNVPGSNVPMHSTLSYEVARELFGGATSSYTRVIAAPDYRVSTAMRPVEQEWLAPGWVTMPSAEDPVDARSNRPGANAAFQLPDLANRTRLIQEFQRMGRDEEAEEDAALGKPLDTRLDTTSFVEPFQPAEPTAPSGEDAGLPERTDLPEPGDDVFHDVLVALQQQRAQEARPSGEGEDVRRDVDEDGNYRDMPEEGFISEKLVMIHVLGGESRDYFNEFMRKGDAALKQGRYYDAARGYEGAAAVNPSNPLAHVGAALALFGAGEYYSASGHLEAAMRIFPPLMETRLDIAGMMDYALFEERLRRFKEDVQEDGRMVETAPPLLLATYLHNCIGEDAEARIYAFRLRAVGRDNELYQAYARFVLSGKLPDEVDATDETLEGALDSEEQPAAE